MNAHRLKSAPSARFVVSRERRKSFAREVIGAGNWVTCISIPATFCANGIPSAGNPSRISLGEIHPIYEFEVCTANCDAAGTWLTLDEWAKQN